MSQTQYHLSSQYYDICIRRARSSCAVCYFPVITPTLSSYGVSGGSPAPGTTNNQAIGSVCTGVTVITPTAADQKGYGDYLDIANAQDPAATGAGAGVLGTNRICGTIWNANAIAATAHATVCSFSVPFKIGVHFDADEYIVEPAGSVAFENYPVSGNGLGYSGFYLDYWQQSC